MKAHRRKIRVRLLKQQNQFRRLKAKWAAARGGVGSGKTTGAIWWLLERLESYPKAAHFVVGADYEQLRRGFFQSLLGILENVLGWEAGRDFKYRETPSPMLTIVRSGARLRALSAEQAERIRSVEIQTLYCEEPPTWNNGENVFRVLFGRLRPSIRSSMLYPDMQPQGRMTFNPGGEPGVPVGSWLYKILEEQWPAEGWPCLRFSLRDNVLMDGLGEYVHMLEVMFPEHLWEAEIDGHYKTVGGSVYRNYDSRIHNGDAPACFPAKTLQPRPLCWTLDFNVHKMCSIIGQYHAQREISLGYFPDKAKGLSVERKQREDPTWQRKVLYLLDEIVLRDAGAEDVVTEFLLRYGDHVRKHGLYLYGDPSGDARNQAMSSKAAVRTNWAAIIAALGRAGVTVANGKLSLRILNDHPSVGDRINMVNVQMRDVDGTGMIVDAQRCPDFISDLQQVAYKPGTNDLDKRNPELTHMSDAAGYMIWVERMLMMSPAEVKFRFDR